MDIDLTRSIIRAALDGSLAGSDFKKHDLFNFDIPIVCPGVDKKFLDPIQTWDDKAGYLEKAKKLASEFAENFKKYGETVADLAAVGPKA